ncbi:MAG TPA: GDP-mannose 4,6-dehydratase [Jatrophihabitantaceae bacterium]|jgi:UDP-glucose 4-epimerase|nr:GDP-mannose 4,6-dehydratase [Jatrophihabitantaceae bacterium]
MRTLITGGAGFIGSHLTELLLRAGDDVVILDDLSTGRMENLTAVEEDARLQVILGSVLDDVLVDRAVHGSDRIFHLAAAVGVHTIVDHPLESLRTNLHGTETVLEAAVRHRRPVLIASTSEIYGKNTADRLSEDADRILGSPLLARWTYAAAKGLDEAIAHAHMVEHGLRAVIVRLFNTVGPRQRSRYGMVMPSLVGQALRGEPMTVFGDGEQTRCFSYVADIVAAMRALAEHPAAVGQAVNLGGGVEISINHLAERIRTLLGSSSPIQHVPYERAYGPGYEDMRRRVPDNSLAHALVGFHPRTGIDEMVVSIADYMRTGDRGASDAALTMA